MDDDDVFVLKSDSETEKNDKQNENIDQNKKFDQKISLDSIINQQKKDRKKEHRHHHHHHHHKSKSKSKTKSETKKEDSKLANLPVAQNETFCIDNTPKEEDENFIVNFKFELSDSVELSDEKLQTPLPPLQMNSMQKDNQNSQKQIQVIDALKQIQVEDTPKQTQVKDTPKQTQIKDTPKQTQVKDTPKQTQVTETPKTEIKVSSIPITDIIQTPIVNKKVNLDNVANINCCSEKADKISQNIFVKKQVNTIQTPKKIRLSTNRNTTNSAFEYKILSFLDQSLNHLSQDFLDDFQYYVQNALSYENIFDDFITSLNTEILDIFHNSNITNEKEIRLIDDIEKITEKFTKDMPHLNFNDKNIQHEEDETIEIGDLIKIQEKFFSAHQFFNEIQLCNSEKSNLQLDDEIKSQYTRLRNAQLKRIELESINEIQIERLNNLEDQIKEIQEKNELNITKKFTNCNNSKKTLKDSINHLIEDLQNMVHDENHQLKNIPNFDMFKKSFNNYFSERDQLSYEIEFFSNFTEKSFCSLFSQMNNAKSFQIPFSHRRENIISE